MSYILGGVTLPTPKAFKRDLVEMGSTVVCIDGTTKKDITNRKERYTLRFEMLTLAQVNSILSIYNDQTTKNFQSTETNLTIASTPVHIDIPAREYNTGGDEYREDLTLILTEVN